MGREVAVLRDGVLAQVAPPEDLYRQPADAALAQFVGEAALLPGVIAAGFATCALGALSSRAPRRTARRRDGAAGADSVQLRARTGATQAKVLAVTYTGRDASVAVAWTRAASRSRRASPATWRPSGGPGVAQRRRPGDGLSAPRLRSCGSRTSPGAGRQRPRTLPKRAFVPTVRERLL